MNLNDLITALAEEIDIVRSELDDYIGDMAECAVDTPEFSVAMKAYGEQVARMGEAAEEVGFPGLQAVCQHVADNIYLLLETSPEERGHFIAFLRSWPDAIVHYLHELNDPSVAAGLLDLLRGAPIPLEEDKAFRIMYKLGAFPAAMEALEHADGQAQRPIVASIEDVALVIPEDAGQSLLDGFFQEAPGQTERLIHLIEKMVGGDGDLSDLVAAKRIVHTLKGTGAMIGLAGLANIGHYFEDILEYFESHEGKVNSRIATLLLDCAYCLAQMVAYLMEADEYPTQARDVLQNILDLANSIDHNQDLERISIRGAGQVVSTAVEHGIKTNESASGNSGLRVAMERIEALFRTSAEISLHTAMLEAQTGHFSATIKQLHNQQLRVKKRLFELENIVDVHSLAAIRGIKTHLSSIDDGFDTLEFEHYNELHSSTHALMEEFNDVILLSARLEDTVTSLKTLDNRQQVLARDLQHLIISTRMSEVGMLEARLQRNVRTTCQMTGKSVELQLIGGDTLIDTDILNRLADPLLHLLRNAVDHGIELPAERESLGKKSTGIVRLAFSTQGEQIILCFSDDGRGLDYDQIRQRAEHKGLIRAEEKLSRDEIARLIFLPGFSTRDAVSEVSGRGIGLDVVRDWLTCVNGEIQVESEPGQGMTITLRFASSLTTVQSLIVEVGGQPFALPSVQIEQAFARDEGYFVESVDNLHYHHGNRVYAAKRLADLLGFNSMRALDESFVVLIRVQDEVWALAVDRLIDSRKLLLKPADEYVSHIDGILGTSVLGSGSIAIHLDLAKLFAHYGAQNYRGSEKKYADISMQIINLPTVLVVDDSLSMRNTLQVMIEDAGYDVKTARDGIEAINILDSYTPDIVLTDLEMPNMNGVELTTHIRNRQQINSLPVVMITSRSQEKHRKLAMAAGVDAYFTKPYNDVSLLQTISRLIRHAEV